MAEPSCRRCLVCANLNPCNDHSASEQQAALDHNDRAIAALKAAAPAQSLALALERDGYPLTAADGEA